MANIEELLDSLAQDAAPVKPAPHPLMLSLGWVAAAVGYIVLSLWISGLRPDLLQKFHEPWFVAEMLVLALIVLATSLSAAVLAFPDLHQMRKAAVAPAGLFAIFIVTIFFAWRADAPPAPLPMHSFECTVSITLFALLPAVWTFLSMRRFASTHCRWAGSVALLFAFSVGALWLRMYELNDSILHVIEWHYLPMLGIGLIGWWMGKRVLKW
ncbi:MAG: DUF1109 domain-containing protein [Sulfurimicrobium sp.]|nr:DUF1109 domain-containing protein [Sulfurimicrobium sp.]MDP1703777.1 DUF1109 domain-containing protein [Sulfurimicrobium sp.]MDP1896995.1 DUF1109 domain-containing protein [Sulfurimicrobium sp.]MDP2197987.1 DUF1109 domain-containing protein [Sulfurimicrobium sp.]MDP3688543.1 DUF1109 domain-containing protein [Sulfurimicrobium sp.]